MRPRPRRALIAVVAVALCGSACGGEPSGSDEQRPGWTENLTDDSDGGAGEEQAERPAVDPTIDPAQMPPPGVVTVQVDGQTFTFALADATLGSDCELADGRVELRFQSEDATLDVEFADLGPQGGTPGQFAGNAAASPSSLDTGGGEGYASTTATPRIVIEAPHALIDVAFVYRENHTDYDFDEVGDARILATCP